MSIVRSQPNRDEKQGQLGPRSPCLNHENNHAATQLGRGPEVPLRDGAPGGRHPSSAVYFSTRMEDGVALADAGLSRRLAAEYPGCGQRCRKRRDFMADVLGIELPEGVLP